MKRSVADSPLQVSAGDLAEQVIAFWNELTRTSAGTVYALVEELDVSITQIKTLGALGTRNEAVGIDELADAVNLSHSSALRTAAELEQRGWLERQRDGAGPERLAITALGRELDARLSGARLEGVTQYFATLNPGERARLSAAIRGGSREA